MRLSERVFGLAMARLWVLELTWVGHKFHMKILVIVPEHAPSPIARLTPLHCPRTLSLAKIASRATCK